MSAVNPYRPPSAAVADILPEDGVQPVRLWSTKGRIGRLRYMAYGTAAYLLLAVAGGVAGGLSAALSPTIGSAVSIAAVVAAVVFWVLISIQRAHDMDWSGWSVLLWIIPVASLIWIFKGGSDGANGHGAPPPPNTWGVRILGLLMPVIMLIGVLAAIALPMYQDIQRHQVRSR
jgi:uncharacterized membrane protein YhaH (DUF805 family)